MMTFRFGLILLLLACAYTVGAAPPALSIVPGAGAVLINSGAARYEFGTRLTSDASPLTHTFFLHNGTKTTLLIERTAASCDCVQANIGEGQALPIKVIPGQTVPVLITITLRRLLPGDVSKSVWLYRHSRSDQGLRLEMHGTVHDASLPIQMGIPKHEHTIKSSMKVNNYDVFDRC